jgi:hypothetical protein
MISNKTFETGLSIEIEKMVKNIGYPDYPDMPSREKMLPMPQKF